VILHVTQRDAYKINQRWTSTTMPNRWFSRCNRPFTIAFMTVWQNPEKIQECINCIALSERRCFTESWKDMELILAEDGIVMVEVIPDLIDKIWTERPPSDGTEVVVFPVEYAGVKWQVKLDFFIKKTLLGKDNYLRWSISKNVTKRLMKNSLRGCIAHIRLWEDVWQTLIKIFYCPEFAYVCCYF